MAYSDDLRKEIGRLHMDERKSTKEILDSLGDNSVFQEELPSERTVQRIVKAISDSYTPEQQALDRPWQLHPDMGHGITPEDVPTLLSFLKWLTMRTVEDRNTLLGAASPSEALTIRRARWISTLYYELQGASIFTYWDTACMYAHRERWAAIENMPFETVDLDMWIAYLDDRENYQLAIDSGAIPEFTLEKQMRDENPLDPQEAGRQVEKINSWLDN